MGTAFAPVAEAPFWVLLDFRFFFLLIALESDLAGDG